MTNILLIEPDIILAKSLSKYLEEQGYKISVCHNADGALTLLDKTDTDLIIMELLLPANGGVELIYEIRSYQDLKELPVIVLSFVPFGRAGITRLNMKSLGINAYLYKPATSNQDLTLAIDDVLVLANK